MKLTRQSVYLPEVGECFTCPYVNKCQSGAKCFKTTKDGKKINRENKEN